MTGLAFNPCVYCTHKNCNLCELEMFRKNQINIAKEIFEEIEKLLCLNSLQGDIFTGKYFDVELETDIAELKKKYTEGES